MEMVSGDWSDSMIVSVSDLEPVEEDSEVMGRVHGLFVRPQYDAVCACVCLGLFCVCVLHTFVSMCRSYECALLLVPQLYTTCLVLHI